jgi:hypothetical protein
MVNMQRIAMATLCIGLLLLAFAPSEVAAQEFSKDAHWETFSNSYISIGLGCAGWVKLGDVQYNIPSRWSVVTAEGDPETTNDDNRELVWLGSLCPCGNFGFFKVKIGNAVYMLGETTSGGWSKVPLTYETPAAGYGAGRTGGYIEGTWLAPSTSAAVAKINIKMSIVRDQCRFEITLTNVATTTQSIGFGMNGDVEVGDSWAMGYPYIAGRGYTRQTASTLQWLGTTLAGTNVPDMIETMDSVDSPVTVARNTLALQDCVVPDYVAIGQWGELSGGTTWLPQDYNPDPLKPVTDYNWLLCWKPVTLLPGASKKIVTYYGVGAATAAWNYRVGRTMEQDSCALAVQGPRSLKYDSTTLGQNDLTPNPFEIKAYLYNLATDPGPYNLEDVTMSLYLPSGLSLGLGQSAKQIVGEVSVNSESDAAVWQVEPTGEYSGELEYFVTARDVSGWQQVVSRKIFVPATRRSVFRSGYQLMHVPFTFNNPSIEHALGLTAGSFAAKYYDPSTGQYASVTRLQPGRAFWVYISTVPTGGTQPFPLAGDAAIIGEQSGTQMREQYVELERGWNLIGNPFVYPMYWGQVLVASTSDAVITTVSLDQAVTNGWLSKTVYSWIPESSVYEHFKDNDSLLLPWRGYWVRANVPVTLVLRPPVPPASDVLALPGGYGY